MRTTTLTMFVVTALIATSSIKAVAIGEEPRPSVHGSRSGKQFGPKAEADSYKVEASLPARTETSERPGSRTIKYPYKETMMVPWCADAPPGTPPGAGNCTPQKCEGDGVMMRPFTKTVTGPDGGRDFNYDLTSAQDPRCVHETPDGASMYTAAQVEFLRSKPKLSAPGSAPPGGVTLVGTFNTLFWTDGSPQTTDRPLLATPVTLRITPVTFTWNFGDGTQGFTTNYPGIPHDRERHPLEAIKDEPDPRKHHPYITHRYTQARVICQTKVTIEYKGEYSVNNNPYQPIDGTITTTSPPRAITTIEYHAELITGPHAPQPTIKPPPSPKPHNHETQDCTPNPHWNQ